MDNAIDSTVVPWGRAYSYTNSKGVLVKVPARPITRPDLQTALGVKQSEEHRKRSAAASVANQEKLIKLTRERAAAGLPGLKKLPMTQKTTQEIAGVMMTRELSKQIRRASEELVNANKEQWLTDLHNAARVILSKAIEERDPHAMMAVWDRIVGKPSTMVDMSVTNDTTVEDIAERLRKLNETQNLPLPIYEIHNSKNTKDTD
jgi:hypothetical protein